MDAKIVVGGGLPCQPDTFSIKKNPSLFFLLLDLLVPELVSMEKFKEQLPEFPQVSSN